MNTSCHMWFHLITSHMQEVLTSISITVVVALLNSISLMVLMVVVLLVYAFWGTALFGQVTKGEGIELK